MLRDKRERILVMADPNAGKSFAYYRMADIDYHKPENWDGGIVGPDNGKYTGPKYWVFDFDDTAPAYMGDGEQFEHLYFEYGGNVYPFPADDWKMAVSSFNYMRAYWKRGDYVVFDVVNRVYEMAQDLIGGVTGVDVDENTVARIIRGRGFGAFEGNQWNAVTRSFLSIYKRCEDGPCHIINLAHMSEVVRARDKRTILSQFDQLGMRPRAPRAVVEDCDTIVALWVVRDIEDRSKADSAARTLRWMTVLKDRGRPTYYRVAYDYDMYEILKRERLNPANNSINVTDPKEIARMMADVEEAMQRRAEAEAQDAAAEAIADGIKPERAPDTIDDDDTDADAVPATPPSRLATTDATEEQDNASDA